MASSIRKPILISGAGLASLLLGQSLRRASIPFIIYERDNSISFRAQGYRLRLSNEGLDAIESTLTPDHFSTFWETCSKTGGGGFSKVDAVTGEKSSTEWGGSRSDKDSTDNKAPGPGSREGKVVGISRGDMRKIFLSGCEDHVKWGHNVTGYELTGSGVRVLFSDGSKSEEGDMLIGGEGIYSKVAKQLSNGALKVYDTGARGIHGQAPSSSFKGLGEGVYIIRDNSNSHGAVTLVTNVRPGDKDDPDAQLGWTMGAKAGSINVPNDDYSLVGKVAADIAKSLTVNWHHLIKPLTENMDEKEASFWKITCSTPTGVPQWQTEPRVTVIGDAAHSMTPAGGIGANTAVRDSALLGSLIADAGGYSETITAAYEEKMRVYASEAVQTSYGLAQSQWGITINENSPVV